MHKIEVIIEPIPPIEFTLRQATRDCVRSVGESTTGNLYANTCEWCHTRITQVYPTRVSHRTVLAMASTMEQASLIIAIPVFILPLVPGCAHHHHQGKPPGGDDATSNPSPGTVQWDGRMRMAVFALHPNQHNQCQLKGKAMRTHQITLITLDSSRLE